METKMEPGIVQYIEIRSKEHDSKKFKYSLPELQLENISDSIKDEYLRDAIMNPGVLEYKYEDEKQELLFDLSLMENTSEIN